MKQVFIFLILLSAISSSCNTPKFNTTPTDIPTVTTKPTDTFTPTTVTSLVDTAETVKLLPEEYINELGIRFHLISPDGEKIALKFPVQEQEINEQALTFVPVMSITNKELVNNYEIQLDRTHTYYYFDTWSPDSTAFVGSFFNADKLSGSELCCGEGIAITNIIDRKAQTSIYSWDWNYANRILWSNDSSMLSVTFFPDEYTTLIIDRYGELMKTLSAGEKAAFWSKNILYYTTKNGNQTELRALDFDTQETISILDDFRNIYYIAQNEKLGEVLLAETINQENNIYSATKNFYILDINSKTIKQIDTPSPNIIWAYPSTSSLSQEYVALSVSSTWEESYLWLFDWKTYGFKEYGRIKDLFGWYENIDGFLITSLDGKQRIIKP
jgi:hypothetical protein